MLALLQSYLGTETSHRVGAQHTLNAEYFKRIDALNYTMLHDDGQHIEDLEEADVVLVGVSRTSKTPTSIYLANRGVKTGNVPLVPGIPVAPQVEALTRPLVVGLYASPERIVQIRQNRLLGLKAHHDDDQYIDRKAVAEEVAFSRKLCAKHNWPSIDVTRRSIEETAAAVLELADRAAPAAGGLDRSWRSGSPISRWCSHRRARAGARCCKARHSDRSPGRPISTSAASKRTLALPIRARSRRCWRGRRRCAMSAQQPGRLVLGADQTLALGSAASPSRPIAPLRASSSRRCADKTHALHSAVAIVRDGEPVFEHCAVARLTMRAFSDAFLESYLDAAGDAVTASVGAYQVEGLGIQLFERIEGDHSTILGLPLLPLLDCAAARRRAERMSEEPCSCSA